MLEEDGFAIIEGVFDASEVATMVGHAELSLASGAGDRNALSWPWVLEIAQDPRILALVGEMRPVRAILFDKTPGANWNLGYHQDRALALSERRDVSLRSASRACPSTRISGLLRRCSLPLVTGAGARIPFNP